MSLRIACSSLRQDLDSLTPKSPPPHPQPVPPSLANWPKTLRASPSFNRTKSPFAKSAPSRIINKSRGEESFKSISRVARFENDLWEHLEQVCYDYFAELAKLAGEKVKAEGRTVIGISDIKLPQDSGIGTPTPEALLEKLHALADKDIAQVARFGQLINNWVETEKRRSS